VVQDIDRLLLKLLELLGGERTKAGKYRELVAGKLVRGSLTTFRRHYKSDEATIAEIKDRILWRSRHPAVVEVARQYYEIIGDARFERPYDRLMPWVGFATCSDNLAWRPRVDVGSVPEKITGNRVSTSNGLGSTTTTDPG
jgi:hypothetical protein